MECEYAVENGGCLAESKQIEKLVEKCKKYRSVIAQATGMLDIIPKTNEGNLCIEVKEYLEGKLNEIH